MSRLLLKVLFVFSIALLSLCAVAQTPALSEPALSPDAREIAFVSGGDIWTVPSTGGDAHLLISDPATESRPMYSPDGKYLAFLSTRTGNGDIYLLNLQSDDLKRTTYDDALDQLDGWSRDSRWLYFSSTSHDISGMNDVYRVSVAGGTPMQVSGERYVNEFFAAAAPNNRAVAFSARGIDSGQWWRKGHAHIDQSEIWMIDDVDAAVPKYEPLVSDNGGKNLWPMFAPDGTLYFMSDKNGTENLYKRTGSAEALAVTHFTNGRVLWPTISANGAAIVFERDFSVWKYDTATGSVAQVPITPRGSPAGAGVEHRTLTSGFRDMALSPDGKKVAFIAHGEIFAASAKDGGEAIRITNTIAPESQVIWAPDNKRVAYVSSRGGHDHIYLYDFPSEKETQLTNGAEPEEHPLFSPDGKKLAFQRGHEDIMVLDLASKKETIAGKGMMGLPPFGSDHSFDWSPDSKWLGFLSTGERYFETAHVVKVDDGADSARPVSFVANTNADEIRWSPDGKFLLMSTGQRTEEGEIARIDLVPHTPRLHEDEFRDLFKEEKPTTSPDISPEETDKDKDHKDTTSAGASADKQAEPAKSPSELVKGDAKADKSKAKKPVEPVNVVFSGIRERLNLLPVGLDVRAHSISPDGKWLALIATAAGQQNVYVYSLDELAKEPPVAKQITATAGRKSSVQWAPDSKSIFYVDQGKIYSSPIDTAKPKQLQVSAELDVDFAREKSVVFEEGWRMLRDNFFDPQMNGVNWSALHDVYAAKAHEAQNGDDLRRIMSLMIGELNSSHSGIRDGEQVKPVTGRIGLRFDRHDYETSGVFKVAEVIRLSPADVAGVKTGETLVAIDGAKLDARSNIDQLLDYKIDRRVELTVTDGAGKTRTVALKPIRGREAKDLLYRQWVERNREYVAKISDGKLGYVHMFDMSEDALKRLYLDLDTENQSRKGVVIDVRNNNGGFVNAYAIDVLARKGYMFMTRRGYPTAPARVVLGQRALELPTVLVTNRHSLSDSEDFTEGYRALHLGSVVGEPTAGWIIYTSNQPLLDGSSIRVPFIRVRDHEGKDMEMHPRAVDVEVKDPIGETLTGQDSQLEAAVKTLLRQINTGSGAPGVVTAGK
ncbi:MAG TPA: DPP IV N-terminal domain-containing protein [Terriglobales bacterium]|nr:DPP IV N-terminal domain-containing protein [Terriglobales bacterium]